VVPARLPFFLLGTFSATGGRRVAGPDRTRFGASIGVGDGGGPGAGLSTVSWSGAGVFRLVAERVRRVVVDNSAMLGRDSPNEMAKKEI
jgi:hypothetical protein